MTAPRVYLARAGGGRGVQRRSSCAFFRSPLAWPIHGQEWWRGMRLSVVWGAHPPPPTTGPARLARRTLVNRPDLQLPHVAGVAQGVTAGLGPHGEAVGLFADGDLPHLA